MEPKRSLGAKTLLYPTPVLVVGTYAPDGRPNVMTAAWGGICCSRPPCVAVSMQKARASHGYLCARGAFTISIPNEDQVAQVDYIGCVSCRNVDKFAALGLTAVRGDHVDAPYVAEYPVVLECVLRHTFELGLHTQFVGEILDVKADPAVLGANGLPDMAKVRPCLFGPSDGYFAVGRRLGDAFAIGKKDR
jgi:flavin reductase (DIM6/NTAB) family NADH-FMN oxidoreductase RutF